jgi:hypothetical protein
VTPEQQRALLAATAAGLDDALRDGFAELVRLIESGVSPRDAVQQVIDGFAVEWRDTMATAFGAIASQAVGASANIDWPALQVTLSQRLYAQAATVSSNVESLVRRHALGWVDSRRLALDLFEGYGFRPPDAEPLQINPRNPKLPRYLREALLTEESLAAELRRAYARLQVNGLSTPALQAAYAQVLDVLDGLEGGPGREVLVNRLRVAFFERMRYFSVRIAQTELHRAYSEREALMLLDDEDVEFVQIRRAPGVGDPCICALMSGRDLYGLGPGVYPKAMTPRPPFHPFCRCVMSPRLDLTGRTPKPEDPNGDAYFLSRLNGSVAGRIMGSRARAEAVAGGLKAEQVVNLTRDPNYHIKPIGP